MFFFVFSGISEVGRSVAVFFGWQEVGSMIFKAVFFIGWVLCDQDLPVGWSEKNCWPRANLGPKQLYFKVVGSSPAMGEG